MWIATAALAPELVSDLAAGRFAALAAAPAADPAAAFARGIALANMGRFREARDAFAAAAADPALADAAAVETGFLDLATPNGQGAVCTMVQALAPRLTQVPLLAARAQHLLGVAQFRRLAAGEALDALSAAQKGYRAAGCDAGEAQVLDTLGQVHQYLGHESAALVCYVRSLTLKGELGDRAGTAITLGNLGRYCATLGRMEDAQGFLARDLALARVLGDARGEARVLIDLGTLARDAGDGATARENLTRAHALAAQAGLGQLEFETLAELALTERSTVRLDAARAAAGAAPSQFDRLMLGWIEARLTTDAPRAAALLTQAADGFRDAAMPALEIEARLALAERLDPAAAGREILIALKRARECGLARYRVRIGEWMERLSLSEAIAEERGRPIDENPAGAIDGYILRERLGEGTFATVWRAFDAERGREVALKLLDLEARYAPAERARLLDSARLDMEAANRARHPGLVKVYAIGRDARGNVYLAVEFIAGSDLRQRFEAGTSRDPRAVCGTLCLVAQALAALHGQGVVHRDLKPENIMLREDGSPVIVDFGIAHIAGAAGATVSRGSPEYFSPQQGRGEPPAPPDDMYALGVILGEWLHGTRPSGPSHKLALFGRGAPKTADALAQALMESDPASRPDADEAARLLKAFAA